MKDLIAEALALYEELQDDGAQFSAEMDAFLEEHSAHPCLEHAKSTQKFLSDRFVFYEEMIARLLTGAPVLLEH